VNPLSRGRKGPASSPFGYFVAKGGAKGKVMGFAPYPPSPCSKQRKKEDISAFQKYVNAREGKKEKIFLTFQKCINE